MTVELKPVYHRRFSDNSDEKRPEAEFCFDVRIQSVQFCVRLKVRVTAKYRDMSVKRKIVRESETEAQREGELRTDLAKED